MMSTNDGKLGALVTATVDLADSTEHKMAAAAIKAVDFATPRSTKRQMLPVVETNSVQIQRFKMRSSVHGSPLMFPNRHSMPETGETTSADVDDAPRLSTENIRSLVRDLMAENEGLKKMLASKMTREETPQVFSMNTEEKYLYAAALIERFRNGQRRRVPWQLVFKDLEILNFSPGESNFSPAESKTVYNRFRYMEQKRRRLQTDA